MKRTLLVLSISFVLLSACVPAAPLTVSLTTAPTVTPTLEPAATHTPTQIPEPTLTPTPALPVKPEAYFPNPLHVLNSENIKDMALLGKLGQGELLDAIVSEDESQLVLVFNTQIITLNARSFDIISQFDVDFPVDSFRTIFSVSPNGKYLAYLTNEGISLYDGVSLHNLVTGEFIKLLKPYYAPNTGNRSFSNLDGFLEFSADSKTLIHGKDVITAWSVPLGNRLFEEEGRWIYLNSDRYYGVENGNTLVIKRLASGKILKSLEVNGTIQSQKHIFSNNNLFVSIQTDEEIAVWEIATNEKIINASGKYDLIKFSPDDTYAYSSNGTRLQIWQVEDGSHLATINGGRNPFFTADGSRIIVKHYSNRVYSFSIYNTSTFAKIKTVQYAGIGQANLLLTPDDAFVIAYSHYQQRLKIIDAKTGEVINEIYGITETDLKISKSNQLVAITDHSVAVYSIPDGELIFEIPILSSYFKITNEKLLTIDQFANLSLWDLETGELLLAQPTIHPGRFYTVPENKEHLTEWGSIINDGTLDTLYKVSNKSKEYWVIGLPTRNYSPESNIYIRYVEENINIYDIDGYTASDFANAILLHQINAPDINPTYMRLTPDGTILIAKGAAGNELIFWDTATGNILQEIVVREGEVRDILVSPQSDRLYISVGNLGSDVGGFNVYRLPDGLLEYTSTYALQKTTKGGWRTCWSPPISLSGDGKYFVGISDQCTLQVIETETWNTIQTIDYGNTNPYVKAAISTDGSILAVSVEHSLITFWDVNTAEMTHTFDLIDGFFSPTPYAIAFEFTPDGQLFVATAVRGGEILLYGLWP